MHTTTRLGLDVLDGSDAVNSTPTIDAQAKGILDNAVTYSQGTLASLPAASLAGRRYYATDISQELYDTGTSWVPVGSATPIGTVAHYAGSSDPVDADGTTRWLVCDGRAISRTTYSALFTRTSTTYGSGTVQPRSTFRTGAGESRSEPIQLESICR
jgi:Phage Tail Collar Domain